uniref:Vegetative cell wall protein gp1precursor n=1 Tax=Oryza sativa subsp. japonica TaxID=39947 RepID=Q6K317_ORYSJ|nr:putative vegetative cell wall protein gp1precursor [Oryza sativa Japonica Group]
MGDANENLAQQGDANKNPTHRGLPPRHLIIPYSIAAAMANRPIRLASQARLFSGGGGSRIVPLLLPDGKSNHIIDTSFTSEEAFVPAAPPPLLVSAARRPVAPSAQPIATMFAWPVPPRGWTVSPTTGRYRFGYGFGGESSSSTALRTPAAPTTTRGPTLLFLPAPPVPAPLVHAPPTLAPPLVVPRGGWTIPPTTSNDCFGDGHASSSTAAPLTAAGHSTPPEPVPSVPVPLGLTMSPTTAHYSFSYGGASSSSATPRAPIAPLALRAPAPHLCVPRVLSPPAPTPPVLATHVPTPPAPAPPVPTPLAPAPPADVPPGFTVSPTITRYSFGYDGASSSSATPRVRTTSLALRAPAPHLRVPRAPAPPVPAPLAPTPPIPTPPALAPPVDVPPGFTVSPTTTRYSFGYGGASSSSAMPHAATAPLALRTPAPHLRVSRKPRSLVLTPPAPAPPVATPPTPATPVPTPPMTAPPADVPLGFIVSLTTTHYNFGYGGASLSSAMPRATTAPLALRGPAPHLRVPRMLAPPIPMPPAPAPPVPTPSMPSPTVPAPPVTAAPATAPSVAAPAAVSHGLTLSPTTTRYSFGYSGVSSPSAVPCTSSVPLALHTVTLTTGRYCFGDSGASSSSTAPRAPTAPLALHAPGLHLRVPPAAAPLPAAPRGWTMPPTTGRYSFSYGGLSLSYATQRAPIAPLALRSPVPHLRARRVPTAPLLLLRRARLLLLLLLLPWLRLRRHQAFEEYLVQRRAIEATVDDTPWEMIGRSRKTGGPMFAVAGGGRDKAEMEAKEARERHKNRMDKGRPPPPLPPSSHRRSRHAPGSSGDGSKKRRGGRKEKQA